MIRSRRRVLGTGELPANGDNLLRRSVNTSEFHNLNENNVSIRTEKRDKQQHSSR